jgi:glycosyltransferase involved in cell wall biosynthesis
MAPRISVLMPCYNHGAFIDDAIDSVLAQTFQDFEIVVVDDGSTEPGTIEKLRALATPRITVFRTENRGLPAARNFGASRASGRLFCALDADDRLAPTWFEKAVAVLDRQPHITFVSHWLETFGDEHWMWTPEQCDLPSLLARNAVNGAALVRREAFEGAGGYDESMRDGCEDWDFWLRLVEQGHQGAIIPEVLFYYRRRSDSMSRVMLDESAYRKPLTTLVSKHLESYRAHLVDVLVAKQAESTHLASEVADLHRDRLAVLEPSLARAREDAEAVANKVERAAGIVRDRSALAHLKGKAMELEREIADLRASWSWRLTAPLRSLWGPIARRGRR